MKVAETLLKKALAGSLGHFYIVDGPASLEFVQKFIQSYYSKVENHLYPSNNLMDYPDVFVLTAETDKDENKAYTVLESESLARFFEFKPVQQKRKFAVITEAHRIGNIVANKWLKLFEEPQGESTIFLLNPKGQKLLDTLHSRAIHLRLPRGQAPAKIEEWTNFLQKMRDQTLATFIETYSRGEKSLESFLEEMVQWEAEQLSQPDAKKAMTDWLKSYQEMDTFHQPTATKWTLFYSYLNQYVLPRVSH